MECREPGVIRDEELLAYLSEGKTRPRVTRHLAKCQYCSSKLAEYRRLERALSSKLYRWNCPPNDVLGEYHLGLLNKARASSVNIHLGMCGLCSAEIATLAGFLANDPILEGLEALHQREAVTQGNMNPNMLDNRGVVEEAKQALHHLRDRVDIGARRIIATLVPPQPRLTYQRDVAMRASMWPRYYTAQDVSVSIQVEQEEASRKKSLQLIGFVTKDGAALESLQGTPVVLSSQAHIVSAQNIDELGNFVFSAIKPETYTLEVQFPENIIVIDDLSVMLHD